MPPTNPCARCRCYGSCSMSGQMNRLAMEAWVDGVDQPVCEDFEPDFYKGLEGCFA